MRTLHTPAPNTIKERIDEIIRTKPLEKPTRPLICPKDQCRPLSSYSRLEEEFLNLAAASGKSKTPQMREALLVWNWPLYSLSACEGAACALQPPRRDTRATYTTGASTNNLDQNIQPHVLGPGPRRRARNRVWEEERKWEKERKLVGLSLNLKSPL